MDIKQHFSGGRGWRLLSGVATLAIACVIIFTPAKASAVTEVSISSISSSGAFTMPSFPVGSWSSNATLFMETASSSSRFTDYSSDSKSVWGSIGSFGGTATPSARCDAFSYYCDSSFPNVFFSDISNYDSSYLDSVGWYAWYFDRDYLGSSEKMFVQASCLKCKGIQDVS